MFKNRAFQVKVVKDANDVAITTNDPAEALILARAYAELVKDVSQHIGSTICTVIIVKTACDLIRIGARALVK